MTFISKRRELNVSYGLDSVKLRETNEIKIALGVYMERSVLLDHKKIKLIDMPIGGVFLRQKWEECFAGHLTSQEKKDIYLDDSGFLWHLFSYEKRDCLSGQRADEAFQNKEKSSCYVFWQFEDYGYNVENANNLSIDDFKDEFVIYVADQKFRWTYVKTHETGLCGPYFCQRDEELDDKK